MKKNALHLLLITICLLPSSLFAGQSVTAKGVSFFEPGREVLAREKAVDEAKRAAIEQAVGTAIESKTIVEDFQVVKDQIFSRTAGYLKDLKILEERKTDLGSYEVTIQAVVEIADLVTDLDRFQKVLQWQKNPRISIKIDPDLNKEYVSAAKKSANLLTNKLKRDGFRVFKPSDKNDIQMGLLVNLVLEHASKETTFQGLTLTVNEISLSANIYRPGSGEIIATSGAVKSMPGENSLQVLDKGARACVEAIWKDLRRKLVKLWEKELYSERDISLTVKNIPSHARAEEVAFIFKTDASGVLAIDLIRFDVNTAEYSLKYRGWPDHFLNEIQLSYFKNKYFVVNLEQLTGNQLIIRIK